MARRNFIRGSEELKRKFLEADVYVTKNAGPMCEAFAQRTRTWLHSNASTIFPEHGGRFLSQTWQDPAKVTKSRATAQAGWGGPSAAYGYVLERGPFSKVSWPIAPKNVLAQGHGKRKAGDPILALRMVGPGGVFYAKKVTHVWSDASLRPHWSKAIEAETPWLNSEWTKILGNAFSRVG